MQIEIWDINRMIPYADNPRKNDHAVKKMAAAMLKFGCRVPILVKSTGEIIDGHLRFKAAKHAMLTEMPVIPCDDMTPEQIRAFRISVNKMAELAVWDFELLQKEISLLGCNADEFELLGFNIDEIERINKNINTKKGLTDENALPDEQNKPVAKLGDLWKLGQHKIICGSCTDADVVNRLFAGSRPHLMVTDPPYGVEYDPSWRSKTKDGRNYGKQNKDLQLINVLNDDQPDWLDAWNLFPGDVAYVWHAGIHADVVADSLLDCHFELRSQIIWAKSNLVISRGHYHCQHEPCWYAVRKGKNAHWNGSRKRSTLWRNINDCLREGEEVFIRRIDAEIIHAISGDHTTIWEIPKPQKSETGHSTQKPVECMRRPILNNSKTGEAVYDPFVGSGTTIIAAEQTNRICYAAELNPVCVDMAIKRWENFTGSKAILL